MSLTRLVSNARHRTLSQQCILQAAQVASWNFIRAPRNNPAIFATVPMHALTHKSCLRRYQSDASDEFYDCQPDNGNLRHGQSADDGAAPAVPPAATPAATVAPARPQQSAPGDLSWIQCVISYCMHCKKNPSRDELHTDRGSSNTNPSTPKIAFVMLRFTHS